MKKTLREAAKIVYETLSENHPLFLNEYGEEILYFPTNPECNRHDNAHILVIQGEDFKGAIKRKKAYWIKECRASDFRQEGKPIGYCGEPEEHQEYTSFKYHEGARDMYYDSLCTGFIHNNASSTTMLVLVELSDYFE